MENKGPWGFLNLANNVDLFGVDNTQNSYGHQDIFLHPWILTVRPSKMVVGRKAFPIGFR